MQSQGISEDQKLPPKGGAEVDVFLHSYTNADTNSANVHKYSFWTITKEER